MVTNFGWHWTFGWFDYSFFSRAICPWFSVTNATWGRNPIKSEGYFTANFSSTFFYVYEPLPFPIFHTLLGLKLRLYLEQQTLEMHFP